MNVMLPFANTDQIVVRLDIAMEETSRVNVLDALDELVGEHQNGVQSELSVAIVEKVFEARAKKIHDEGGVISLLTDPVDLWCSQPVL